MGDGSVRIAEGAGALRERRRGHMQSAVLGTWRAGSLPGIS